MACDGALYAPAARADLAVLCIHALNPYAFYTDTPEWKRAIVDQAQEAALQGVAGLSAD